MYILLLSLSFFFNETATSHIYTLSLHDALPIWREHQLLSGTLLEGLPSCRGASRGLRTASACGPDRKSTRLNSSHPSISYAVFCLKKKTEDIKYPALTRLRLQPSTPFPLHLTSL